MRTSYDFSHVLWLGGSAGSGKSRVARFLTRRPGRTLYACDAAFSTHRHRATPERHPHFQALRDLPPERLFAPPAADRAEELLAFYRDEWELVLEDLRAIPAPVVAEGVGLLPGLVAAVAPDPARSLFRIATPGFRRRVYAGREEVVRETLKECADPAAAFGVWMERDDLIADFLEREARRLGLRVKILDHRR